MKLFIISDIHGSLFYLKKVLNIFEKSNCDFLIILGDELYHGARNPLPEEYNPKKVIKLLNSYKEKIIAVRGNCDSEVDQKVLDYPIQSDYSIILYEGRRLFLTHGHLYNPDNMPPLSKGDIFLYGHTHVPAAYKQNGIYIVNPGSISIPKENTPNSYCILESTNFYINDFDGNTILGLNF